MSDPSRRSFLLGTVAAASAAAQSKTLTAGEVVERIKANVGVEWAKETVDRIIAGEAQTPVKGIATTMMARMALNMAPSKGLQAGWLAHRQYCQNKVSRSARGCPAA